MNAVSAALSELKIDQLEMAQLMVDSNLPQPRTQRSSRGMATGEVTLPMLTARFNG